MTERAPVIVKLGSALLSTPGGLNQSAIDDWCAQIAAAREAGERIVVVSSGAVAAGSQLLGLSGRPTSTVSYTHLTLPTNREV